MLDSLPVILIISTILGFLSGLGVGGGSLLILWLTLVLNIEPGTARALNLLFFIPSALITCLFRWRQGCISPRTILPAVITGCAAAFLFSFLSSMLELSLLKKLFGGLLIATGLRELLFHNKKPLS